MPDARINEGKLANRLNTSRTPVREALNRLVAEGFLTFQGGRGFFCRSLSPALILELYEARVAIECEALRLSCEKASDTQIAELKTDLNATEPRYETCTDTIALLEMDEAFHNNITALSGNRELMLMLRNINDRIRYVRLINLKSMRDKPAIARMSAHRLILDALLKRDATAAVAAMRAHIQQRREETTEAVRIAFSQLYVPAEQER